MAHASCNQSHVLGVLFDFEYIYTPPPTALFAILEAVVTGVSTPEINIHLTVPNFSHGV
jgi:hypothetical protein